MSRLSSALNGDLLLPSRHAQMFLLGIHSGSKGWIAAKSMRE
jgi:hypothetical protein